jgi:2-C-methyl-D-erythritol 2,4-cyclodiphosphate synthase
MTESLTLIGHGYDVHRFSQQFNPARPLILAGYQLPDQLSLDAHSDGDVILHALCDAILGAAGLGDIGEHFPDSDAEFAGIDSSLLLQRVMSSAADAGLSLVNADITVIAQVPRLQSHRASMRSRLAELLALPLPRVNLKATTTEGLGYIGRKEGIACHCVVLLQSRG